MGIRNIFCNAGSALYIESTPSTPSTRSTQSHDSVRGQQQFQAFEETSEYCNSLNLPCPSAIPPSVTSVFFPSDSLIFRYDPFHSKTLPHVPLDDTLYHTALLLRFVAWYDFVRIQVGLMAMRVVQVAALTASKTSETATTAVARSVMRGLGERIRIGRRGSSQREYRAGRWVTVYVGVRR